MTETKGRGVKRSKPETAETADGAAEEATSEKRKMLKIEGEGASGSQRVTRQS